MSTELVTQPILDFSMVRKNGKRQGPKGYDVYRFVASAEVIDHQNEIVDIKDLLSIQETMLKQGGRIQGFHSNYPAGEFFDYGLVTIKDQNDDEVLSIWLDIEIYDDYPSQKEMKGRLDLPKGHPKRINGVSLGGKSYQRKRRCDADRCWFHLEKLEGWEYSLVDAPACPLALRIDEYNDKEMSKLEINATFDDIYEKEGLTVTQANEILKSKIKKERPRGEDGRFLQPDEDCPTGDCPEDEDKVIKIEEEGKKKKEEVEKPKPDKEETEEESTEEGEEEPTEEPTSDEEYMEEETVEGEAEGISPEEGIADAYGATSSTDTIEEVNMKLDTLMAALNIGKGEDEDFDLSDLTEAITHIKKERNEEPMIEYIEKDGKKYKLVEEEEVPKIIEKDGAKYQLVIEEPPAKTEIKKEVKKEVKTEEVSTLEKNVASLTELVTNMNSKLEKREVSHLTADPGKETEVVDDKAFGKRLIRKAITSLKESDDMGHLDEEELNFRVRTSFMQKSFPSMSLEDAGIILQ